MSSAIHKLKDWYHKLLAKPEIWKPSGMDKKASVPVWVPLEFKSNGFLTLGAEVELQLIDPVTGNLLPRADEILLLGKNIQGLHQEFYKSTLEIVTTKCDDVHQIERDLKASIGQLREIADPMGIKFSTTGCHPFAKALDCEISDKPRYHELIDRNQWLTRHMTVYGLHVHIGMRSGDEAIRFCNFFLRLVPHFLALSASSPFSHGVDTGLSSFRPSTYEALPTAGYPYLSNSWQEFNQLCEVLARSGAIQSLKDLWWDIRPSPGYGTLEIRICDGLATLSETTAVVAFIHCLAAWFADNSAWLEQVNRPPLWILRENKWRAMRHGLNANFVINTAGETRLLREELKEWFDRLAPYAAKYKYAAYFEELQSIIANGNSSDRQRKVFEATGSTRDVVMHNVAEFEAQRPLPVVEKQ